MLRYHKAFRTQKQGAIKSSYVCYGCPCFSEFFFVQNIRCSIVSLASCQCRDKRGKINTTSVKNTPYQKSILLRWILSLLDIMNYLVFSQTPICEYSLGRHIAIDNHAIIVPYAVFTAPTHLSGGLSYRSIGRTF